MTGEPRTIDIRALGIWMVLIGILAYILNQGYPK